MTGFVFKNPNSQYYQAAYRVWDNDKQKWKRVTTSTKCTDKDLAEEILSQFVNTANTASNFPPGTRLTKEYVETVVRGILGAAGISVGDFDRKKVGVLEFFDRYIDGAKCKVASATFQTYSSHFKRIMEWIAEEDAEKEDIEWFTLARCEDFYVSLLSQLTPSSANEKFNFLSRILDRAVDEEHLSSNAARKVKRVKKGETLDRQPFTLAEVKQVVNWLLNEGGERNLEWARATMIGIMVGSRIKDAVMMKVSDLEDGVLTYKQSKTKKTSRVPLIIKEYADILAKFEGEYFCPILRSTFSSTGQNYISSEFADLVSAAGVKQSYHIFEGSGRKVAQKTFHSLRHTFRTIFVAGGGSDAQADTILGHSPGQGKRYTHSEMDSLKSALERAFN